MERILVLSDLSTASEAAFLYARDEAKLRSTSGVHIDIVTVLEPIVPAYVEFEFGLSLVDTAGVTVELKSRAKEKLTALKMKYFESFLAEIHLLELVGTAPKTILEFARANSASMIVMSTHGRSGVERLMLGSVAEKVIRNAPCPVLIVPAT